MFFCLECIIKELLLKIYMKSKCTESLWFWICSYCKQGFTILLDGEFQVENMFSSHWMLEAMEQLSLAKSDASLIIVSLDIFLFSKTCHIFSFDSLDPEIVQWYVKVWNLFIHFVGNSKMCFHLKSLSAIGNLFHNIFPYPLPSDFFIFFQEILQLVTGS